MTEFLMFEVDVKNVTEERRGGGDQLGFGVLMVEQKFGLLLLPSF